MTSLKYTDRDVRENQDELTRVVYDYLFEYQGEFQFLVDCKMRVVSEYDLTIGMIRGVLNCMRVDPRAPSLPDPIEWGADVIPLHEPQPSRRRYNDKKNCENTEPHQHSQDDFKLIHYCPGRYAVTRNEGHFSYKRDAKIHPEYLFVTAKSDSSILVHRATSAEVEWYPHIHEFGWARKPDVILHTNCRYPYYLRNGLLLTPGMVQEYAAEYGLVRCQRCFTDDAT